MGISVVTGPIIPETVSFPLHHAVLVSQGVAVVGLAWGPVENIRLRPSLLPHPDSFVGQVSQTNPIVDILGKDSIEPRLLLGAEQFGQVTTCLPAEL